MGINPGKAPQIPKERELLSEPLPGKSHGHSINMYSRSSPDGRTPQASTHPRTAHGVREPSYRHTQLPPNYSGNAFRDPPDMEEEPGIGAYVTGESHAPGTRAEDTLATHVPQDVPHTDTAPAQYVLPLTENGKGKEKEENENKNKNKEKENEKEKTVSWQGMASWMGGDHFPFGHGLGDEELLLLGLMLFLLKEGEHTCAQSAHETVLLLGLLLLCG